MWSPVSDLLAFVGYALAACLSPGPANATLAMLSVRNGLRDTMPAVAGVSVALFCLLAIAGSGLGVVLAAIPAIRSGLLLAGTAYLLYLAWTLWQAAPVKQAEGAGLMGFWGALLLQLANPKALMVSLAACSFLAPAAGMTETLAMAGIFTLVSFLCSATWALLGDRLSHWLAQPDKAQAFSRAMSLLLLLTVLSMFLDL